MGAGRPVEYNPKICDELKAYFASHASCFIEEKIVTVGKGWQREEKKRYPTEIPTIEYFCCTRNIPKSSLYMWAEKYPELSDALTWARDWRKHLIIAGGSMGIYDSKFIQFAAVNLTDMRNQLNIENNINIPQLGQDGMPVLGEIAQEVGRRIAQGIVQGAIEAKASVGSEQSIKQAAQPIDIQADNIQAPAQLPQNIPPKLDEGW
jgi:hypothetical protein